MNQAEALRSIQDDLLEYIQEKVTVTFDQAGQKPTTFRHGRKTHVVGQILGRFRTGVTCLVNAYLVSTSGREVFLLYFHPGQTVGSGPNQTGCWILGFRIIRDDELMAFYREDRKMLIDINFKRIVDFHGHLCPDLVVGGKLCVYIQSLFTQDSSLSIIAENRTSALDAIQIMLGATVGNQRLQIMDFGKHNYTLLPPNQESGLRFSLRGQNHGDEAEYNALEQKIINNQAILDDVVQFQGLLDNRVKYLISLSPEQLFDLVQVEAAPRPVEMASVYLTCSACQQQILKDRVVYHHGVTYCIPCFQHSNLGCQGRSLQ